VGRGFGDDGTGVTVPDEHDRTLNGGRGCRHHAGVDGEVASRVGPDLPARQVNGAPTGATRIEVLDEFVPAPRAAPRAVDEDVRWFFHGDLIFQERG
jgi:hypothetical protein